MSIFNYQNTLSYLQYDIIFLITDQNLNKWNLMLKDFQETFQSFLNHYQ